MRGLSVVLGASAGFMLGGNNLGLLIGVGAGGLTTTVVGVVKARLKRSAS